MTLKELKLRANSIRKSIIHMLNRAGSGHSAGALGMADLFATLYFDTAKIFPKNPTSKMRDFIFLSNGHTCPVLYATLAEAGFFPKHELDNLRKLGTKLQGHPHHGSVPGIENSSGPLGQGLSQAVGVAAILKREGKTNKVYCFVGDGEIEEGQCWEAFMFAAKEKLNNLVVIVDRNHIQIDGRTDKIMHLEPLHKKLSSFNFAVIDFNGNDIRQIKTAFKHADKLKTKPVCLIAKTTAGKGVSFMEGKFEWHGKAPDDKQTEIALKELDEEEKIIKKSGGRK